ncbi:peptidoglycan DD-metalloendopeptidase family protein [Haloimpatiens sp. FM7330]|uniref:peptidoglycan DD-metalloendopeptidase family protein n=1 Tax=Haloimpatiens sp. FM7330 TaxID=3298610 RepID=UPI0036347549
MNKNNGKTSGFFRKEGFYVALFVCLCIVAAVAAISSRNNKISKKQSLQSKSKVEQKQKANNKPDISLVDKSSEADKSYENALEVKNHKKNTTVNISKKNENVSKVSKNVSSKMIKPVKGNVAREYSEVPVMWKSIGTSRPNFGIDIKTTLGEKVTAVKNGVVVEVGDNKDGFGKQVIIDHKNGLKSVYANLGENIYVKKDQKVKQGEKIGEVGNTTLRSFNEDYGVNLHFEMLKDNKHINPAKYIKY